jgi:hypothetical protein
MAMQVLGRQQISIVGGWCHSITLSICHRLTEPCANIIIDTTSTPAQYRALQPKSAGVSPFCFVLESCCHRSYFHHYLLMRVIATVGLSEADGRLFADLSPYINLAPLAVRDCCPLSRVFTHFRTMGLRHAVVVDKYNEVVGIITRKDLAKAQHIKAASLGGDGSSH